MRLTMIPCHQQRLSLLYRLAPFIAAMAEERIRENINTEAYRVATKLSFDGGPEWHNMELVVVVSNNYAYEELIGPPEYDDADD